ncbi:hypothetical protein B0H13DRAFT_1852524 [Mycena leptocephala]|nr:hypothetical protein B0H13DRAFT_1852524 [Mycena leptocephala]
MPILRAINRFFVAAYNAIRAIFYTQPTAASGSYDIANHIVDYDFSCWPEPKMTSTYQGRGSGHISIPLSPIYAEAEFEFDHPDGTDNGDSDCSEQSRKLPPPLED